MGYTRVDRSQVTSTVAAGSNGVDTASFAGAGVLNVASTAKFGGSTAVPDKIQVATAGTTAVISFTGRTATTFPGCTTTSGGGVLATGGAVLGYAHNAVIYNDIGTDGTGLYTISAGGFAPLFTVGPNSVTFQPSSGNANFFLNAKTTPVLAFQINGSNSFNFTANSLSQVVLYDNAGSPHVSFNKAFSTEFFTNVKFDLSVGFYGTSPIAKRATTADSTDLASVITLANALKADLVAYGLKS